MKTLQGKMEITTAKPKQNRNISGEPQPYSSLPPPGTYDIII